ncbi:hypothetical protein DUZ99_04035 [Xylanibacillus composti]|nr:hypothetical protein [Xylanibacillus composti]
MAEVLTGPFWFWFAVTLTGLLIAAVFNEPLQRISFIAKLHETLDRYKRYVPEVLRVGLAVSLVMQIATRSYLAPEFAADAWWVVALQFIAFLFLFRRRTLALVGFVLLVLYGYAIFQYGWFHALDYVFYAGIIYYLWIHRTYASHTATPVLYLTLGFSLAWAGLEKMTMPELSFGIVERFDVPTFGFTVEHFVLISAFIELGLAWSLIVGILNRFVSILVTLVFIATTTVFGFTEIVGHTIIHALLLMFILEGEGALKTPFQFHRSPALRYSFVLVNFCVLLFGLMALYIALGS